MTNPAIHLIPQSSRANNSLQGLTGGDFEIEKDENGDNSFSFCYQHDIRIQQIEDNIMEVTLFNNANAGPVWYGYNETQGLHLRLDQEAMTASALLTLTDPNETIYSRSQGSLQVLDNGNSLMGYGSTPRIKEYYPDGSLAMSVAFGGSDNTVFSYRAYRAEWVGNPRNPPKVYACQDSSANQTQVYMSWNGATEHHAWSVFAGASEDALAFGALAVKTGFETNTTVPGFASYVRVEALGNVNSTYSVSEVTAVEEQC